MLMHRRPGSLRHFDITPAVELCGDWFSDVSTGVGFGWFGEERHVGSIICWLRLLRLPLLSLAGEVMTG